MIILYTHTVFINNFQNLFKLGSIYFSPLQTCNRNSNFTVNTLVRLLQSPNCNIVRQILYIPQASIHNSFLLEYPKLHAVLHKNNIAMF